MPELLTPIPDQPDGITDESRDMPDPARAAERIFAYVAATGDGLYSVIDGQPLYGRDLESVVRETKRLTEHAGRLEGSLERRTAERDEARRVAEERGTLLEQFTGELSAANAEAAKLRDEVKRLNYHLTETQALVDGWDRIGERISHHIPEHYEAGYAAHEDWARDAADVVAKAHAWRKRGRTTEDGDKIDAAVEKIYPSDDYV